MASALTSLRTILSWYGNTDALSPSAHPSFVDPETGRRWTFENSVEELTERIRDLQPAGIESFYERDDLSAGAALFAEHLFEALATAPGETQGLLYLCPSGIRAR